MEDAHYKINGEEGEAYKFKITIHSLQYVKCCAVRARVLCARIANASVGTIPWLSLQQAMGTGY